MGLALFGMNLFAMPMIAIGIAVRITSGSPVIYRQDRVGRNGRIFKLYKFRTMYNRKNTGTSITTGDDDRVTVIGRMLRAAKLDELPQLYNVTIGDMSFVGPRPDVPGYADMLKGEERRILGIRPGITGPATLAFRKEEEVLAEQDDPVKYNDEFIFPSKVKINQKYLQEYSLVGDIGYIVESILPRGRQA
jgi:lipopolysaccharide/colanic/teichoic acid biosynthesis glycosyltransferase